jgi:orotate phosphoribosyltransferase
MRLSAKETLTMNNVQKLQKLKDAVLTIALQKGRFLLTSGGYSKFYIDSKLVTLNPFYLSIIADLLLGKIENIMEIDAIGGIEMGSVPLSTLLTYKCLERKEIGSFVYRKEPKACGLKKVIEGQLPPSPANIIIIDDSTSSGKSALRVASYLKAQGYNVVKVLSVFDRDRGGQQLLAKHGFKFECLVSMSEFPELTE